MSLRDEPRAGCSSDLNQDALRKLMEFNPCKSTQEFALDLNTFQSTIFCHLKKIEKVSELSVSVPHTLSEKNKEDGISSDKSSFKAEKLPVFQKGLYG